MHTICVYGGTYVARPVRYHRHLIYMSCMVWEFNGCGILWHRGRSSSPRLQMWRYGARCASGWYKRRRGVLGTSLDHVYLLPHSHEDHLGTIQCLCRRAKGFEQRLVTHLTGVQYVAPLRGVDNLVSMLFGLFTFLVYRSSFCDCARHVITVVRHIDHPLNGLQIQGMCSVTYR